MTEDLRLATAELLGALTYGQLRAWTTAVALVPHAPDLDRTDHVVGFADRERDRYRSLRTRLDQLTDLRGPVLERQKPAFDRFFGGIAIEDWLSGVAFRAVGLPMAADCARAVAPTVDQETADVLVGALAGRSKMEEYAQRELRGMLGEEEHHERARRLVAELVGLALTEFTSSLQSTDALRVLFERHAEEHDLTAEGVVKRMAIDVLEAHRRRMHALGLDDLE